MDGWMDGWMDTCESCLPFYIYYSFAGYVLYIHSLSFIYIHHLVSRHLSTLRSTVIATALVFKEKRGVSFLFSSSFFSGLAPVELWRRAPSTHYLLK